MLDTHTIRVRLTEEQFLHIQGVAKAHELSISDFVRIHAVKLPLKTEQELLKIYRLLKEEP